jgi:hypothetical protein
LHLLKTQLQELEQGLELELEPFFVSVSPYAW